MEALFFSSDGSTFANAQEWINAVLALNTGGGVGGDLSNVVLLTDQVISGPKTFTAEMNIEGGVYILDNTPSPFYSEKQLQLWQLPSNQIRFYHGDESQSSTLSLPISTPGTKVYTVPDIGIDTDFLLTGGEQTITGVKAIEAASDTTFLRFRNTGSSFFYHLRFPSANPTADRFFRFPDVVSGSFNEIITQLGTQSISGTKTFTGTGGIFFNGTTLAFGIRNGTTGSYLNIRVPTNPTTTRNIDLIDPVADSQFVLTTAQQTITGFKTFTAASGIVGNGTTQVLQLRNGTTGNSLNVRVPTKPATSRFIDIPDSGADSAFVLTTAVQTIGGTKTFSSGIPITATTNQLVLGTTNTTTISATAPSASRTYTIPDVGANGNFAITQGGTLANYEELDISTSIAITFGGLTPTYTIRRGRSTRIGRIAYIEIFINMNDKGTSTVNPTRLTGLPYAHSNSGAGVQGLGLTVMFGNFSFSSGYTNLWLVPEAGTTNAFFQMTGTSNVAISDALWANFNNNTQLRITGFYSIG